MGKLHIWIGVIACVIFYNLGAHILLTAAAVATIGTFWSYGIMHNFAMEAAKRRPSFRGGFYDVTAAEADAVPDWITNVNMLFSIISIGLLITSVVMAL